MVDQSHFSRGIVHSGVAYLQKPLTPVALARKVREVVRGGKREVDA
jgi:hypothetical protein